MIKKLKIQKVRPRISSHHKILFLVPLLFVVSIPTYLLNFEFFNHSSSMYVDGKGQETENQLEWSNIHHLFASLTV